MTLIQPFAYIAPDEARWDAPVGSVVDGASIPRFAWSIIGGPFEGKYRNASVVHDVACDTRLRPWETVHEMFYTAMLAGGVETVQAKVMYAAVYHFGPRWPIQLNLARRNVSLISFTKRFAGDEDRDAARIPPPPYTLSEGDFAALKHAIEVNDISLFAIREFAAR